jgi:hypothetical protein
VDVRKANAGRGGWLFWSETCEGPKGPADRSTGQAW